jgi:hypothetical protein
MGARRLKVLREDLLKSFDTLLTFWNNRFLNFRANYDTVEHLFGREIKAEVKKYGKYDYWPTTPIPFLGDVERAPVTLLMCNPCMSIKEQEEERRYYSDLLVENLRTNRDPKFWPLVSDRFEVSDTIFGKYWRRIWDPIRTHDFGWKYVSKRVCMLNFVPYASTKFRETRDIFDWESTRLVREVALEKAKNPENLIIVARRVKSWSIPDAPNVVKFSPIESRGIHLNSLSDRISRAMHACSIEREEDEERAEAVARAIVRAKSITTNMPLH